MSGAPFNRMADRLRFGLAFTVFGPALYRASLTKKDFVLPPAGPGAVRHLTLVGRLPAPINGRIHGDVASLVGSSGHHIYPADTIHVTVQNLDALRGVDGADRVLERLSALVGACPPIRMVASGFGVSPDTVFVQLFPIDRTLAHLRREIRALIPAPRLPDKPETAYGASRSGLLFRDMAFANVIRFSGPVSASLVRDIRRCRSRHFGTLALESVELVVTDRLLSAEGTQVRERISFQGADAASRKPC